jgi:hypothetical protein
VRRRGEARKRGKLSEADKRMRAARGALRAGVTFPCVVCGGRGFVARGEWPERCSFCFGPGRISLGGVARFAGVPRAVVDEVVHGVRRRWNGEEVPRVKPSPAFAAHALKLCAWAAEVTS